MKSEFLCTGYYVSLHTLILWLLQRPKKSIQALIKLNQKQKTKRKKEKEDKCVNKKKETDISRDAHLNEQIFGTSPILPFLILKSVI